LIVEKRFYFPGMLSRITPIVIAVFVLAVVVTLLFKIWGLKSIAISSAPLTLVGTALTILYGFRTNSAYDRWWEARTLWGGIVNHSRTWGRQTLSFFSITSSDKDSLKPFQKELIYSQIAFVNALRCHLRQSDPWTEIAPFISVDLLHSLRGEKNVPAAILFQMQTQLKSALDQGLLDPYRFVSMNDTLTELTNQMGGCERIKKTPFPRQYETFPRTFVYIYCMMLPFGLVESAEWYTPLICAVLSFIFVALDTIGRNIESPFENTIHDTPMSSLCRTIEINLRQMLGEKDLPKEIEPVHGFLY
jgi:putative membrane protein